VPPAQPAGHAQPGRGARNSRSATPRWGGVQAERAFVEAEAQLASVLPPDNAMLKTIRGAMADFYAGIGRTAEAAAWKLKAEPPP
jgi:hypothetical protein